MDLAPPLPAADGAQDSEPVAQGAEGEKCGGAMDCKPARSSQDASRQAVAFPMGKFSLRSLAGFAICKDDTRNEESQRRPLAGV